MNPQAEPQPLPQPEARDRGPRLMVWQNGGMRRRITLRAQLLLLQMVIVLITVVGTGGVAILTQQHQLRANYQDRMVGVAQSVAENPVIVEAFNAPDPSSIIQPITELISKSSGIAYAVVMNADGIRYSHPDLSKIGKHVSTDAAEALSGDIYVGTQTGTMGTSWRVKVPIFSAGHAVIGAVSVGVLESDLRNEYLSNATWLFITIGVAAIFGVVGATWVTAVIRKRIFGLEPEQIAGLLEEREAILHGVREGVLAVDHRGRIALINDAAVHLLSLGDKPDVVGALARETLDGSLVELLKDDGAEQSLVLSGERVLLVRRDVSKIGGREIGSTLILRDNTDLHTLLRDLDGVQGLADGLRAQAHGFANKLHVISGLLELGRVEQAVSYISHERAGGALTRLAGQSGIRELEVAALLLMKQVRADELGIDITIEDDSALPALSACASAETLREDLLTITGNLIDNAVEATGPGGRISVLMAYLAGPGEVSISVSDSGEGIAPELRDRVFAAGYSSKAALPGAVSTGRGIGLTLVKRIAARHGGVVDIEEGLERTGTGDSSPSGGFGARITVYLPIAPDDLMPEPQFETEAVERT